MEEKLTLVSITANGRSFSCFIYMKGNRLSEKNVQDLYKIFESRFDTKIENGATISFG